MGHPLLLCSPPGFPPLGLRGSRFDEFPGGCLAVLRVSVLKAGCSAGVGGYVFVVEGGFDLRSSGVPVLKSSEGEPLTSCTSDDSMAPHSSPRAPCRLWVARGFWLPWLSGLVWVACACTLGGPVPSLSGLRGLRLGFLRPQAPGGLFEGVRGIRLQGSRVPDFRVPGL